MMRARWPYLVRPLLAIAASLLVGSILIIFARSNPAAAYRSLFRAGFGCREAGNFCAIWTMLQYATPLILSGLSATVAFRTGLFSIGQAGQMILGATAATWLAARLIAPGILHPTVALVGGVLAGAVWGMIPGILKAMLDVNEVIVTLFLNPIALVLAGPISWQRIPESARLLPLVAGTKLTIGFVLALVTAVLVLLYLWRSALGYEQRMAGQAQDFARFGGMHPRRAVVRAMTISGALAGLAGAIEVLGVQYRFVSSFSAIDQFDGLVVALLGQLHPIGVIFSAFLLGGIRLGAINGLQLETGVPRELGSALIVLFVFFVSAPRIFGHFLASDP